MMKRLLACLLCFVLLCTAGLAAQNDAAGRVQALLGGILDAQLARTGAQNVQAWLDGELARNAGAGSEWNVFSLKQMDGAYDLSAYRSALLAKIQEGKTLSASTRQKYALTLLAAGGNDDFIHQAAQETVGAQGIMTWVYGLHLLSAGVPGSVTAQQAVDELLSMQFEDGGWALRGDVSDVDVTCMTLQALAPYVQQPAVKESTDRAVEMLAKRQLETGDFATFGAPNPESAAQVVIALAALGMDAFQDERFIKDGATLLDVMERFRLEDGSFCHAAGGAFNANATTQVMQALIAWQRMQDGRGNLYHLEVSEAQPQQMKTSLDYKAITAIVVSGLALAASVVLLILRKRHFKNFLAVWLLAGAVIAFVMTTEFHTADGYYTGQAVVKENPIGQVTMSIRCDTALGKTELELPANGVMLAETSFAIAEGDTVYTVLTDAARAHGVRLDTSGTQGMIYVVGINHLYEFACGDLSGWTYTVNAQKSDVGCDQYALADGDVIEWRYTCELGNDL